MSEKRINSALRERIIAYNRAIAEKREKANDLDIIMAEVMKLPYGQLKKVLTVPVLNVLAKYGYAEGE